LCKGTKPLILITAQLYKAALPSPPMVFINILGYKHFLFSGHGGKNRDHGCGGHGRGGHF